MQCVELLAIQDFGRRVVKVLEKNENVIGAYRHIGASEVVVRTDVDGFSRACKENYN